MTSTTTTQAEISARGIVRATWKQHGNPLSGFEFYGTAVKAPAETGVAVAKVVTNSQGITLKSANGRAIKDGAFGNATKFWAIVPADAPRKVEEPKATKTPAEKLAPVKITAAKGGDTTVTPVKGAIAKAITATGKSIMAISRDHGLNPSQMRRLSLDQVAKVDTVRAELIAAALGVPMASLFGEASAKAKAEAKAPKPATTGKAKGRKSKATRSAEHLAADAEALAAAQAAAEVAETIEGTRDARETAEATTNLPVEYTIETPAE
jgi:transposase-like protein